MEVVVAEGRGVSVEPAGVLVDKGCVDILAGGVEEVVEVFFLSCKGAEGFGGEEASHICGGRFPVLSWAGSIGSDRLYCLKD